MNQSNRYFEQIRSQSDQLQAFFDQMPKGADLHHHALGAIWAEDVIEQAAEMGLWVDLKTGCLDPRPAKAWYSVSEIQRNETLYNQVIDLWSVRNFKRSAAEAPQHFFDIFPKLEAVFVDNELFWLKKIAQKAASEHISYIETLIDIPSERNRVMNWALEYDDWSENPTLADLDNFYEYLLKHGLEQAAGRVIDKFKSWQAALSETTEAAAKIGFQLYAIRTFSAPEVFAQLALAFLASANSEEILGVNLVAPEHHPQSLKDYRLHMQFCESLRARFPEVKLALHAGELTKALVDEKELKFHIDLAVRQAGALRIGHGVDILEETAHQAILEYMKNENILLEVLLGSNEFILNVDASAHPFMKYWNAEVPMILATDDPALLRVSLADEFVKAAEAFPKLQYEDFKQLAFNSIDYAFLGEDQIFELRNRLNASFNQFEESFNIL